MQKPFGGKIVCGKKKSAPLNCVWCWSKNILSLLAGKILLHAYDFLPSKVKYIFCFNTRCCSNSQIFFSFGNPPYAKKSKRDSLYFDLLPGPFKSAIIFLLLFVYVINDNKKKRERQYNGYEFFICFYFYLLNTILN